MKAPRGRQNSSQSCTGRGVAEPCPDGNGHGADIGDRWVAYVGRTNRVQGRVGKGSENKISKIILGNFREFRVLQYCVVHVASRHQCLLKVTLGERDLKLNDVWLDVCSTGSRYCALRKLGCRLKVASMQGLNSGVKVQH